MGIYHNVWLNYSACDTLRSLQMHCILGNANSAFSLPFHMAPVRPLRSLRCYQMSSFWNEIVADSVKKAWGRKGRWTTNNLCFWGTSSTKSHIWSISPCSRLPLIMDASFSPIWVLQGTNPPPSPPHLSTVVPIIDSPGWVQGWVYTSHRTPTYSYCWFSQVRQEVSALLCYKANCHDMTF